MNIPNMIEKLKIPQGVQVQIEGTLVKVKGPKGETERKFSIPRITLAIEEGAVSISAKNANRRDKTVIGTTKSHIKNMLTGVTEGHTYKLKICSGHFPMNVSLSGDTLNVKNFLGEKVPRVLKLKKGADVKLEGEIITVQSVDIEKAGQVAANIEQLTRITNRDIRIFQDGIYITKKARKELD